VGESGKLTCNFFFIAGVYSDIGVSRIKNGGLERSQLCRTI